MPGDRAHIDEIRARLDIVATISKYVTLRPAGGAEFKGKCPFHKDDTPSMTVNREKGVWHCFGCGAGGDMIGFVMKIERIEFVDALSRLAQEAGVKLPTVAGGSRENDYQLMTEVAQHFAASLRGVSGEPARDYLLGRGYGEDVWDTFGLGFALPGWDNIKKRFGQYSEEKLISLGLLVKGEKGIYDRFRNRTIFPILDVSGRPIGFGGRAFEDQPKYLNSPQTPLFDKGRVLYGLSWARDAISDSRTAILVEGYTDVISMYNGGIRNVVGSMGTALTSAQAELIGRFASEVVIAYDPDAAGSAASIRGMQILRNTGLAVRVATLPSGEDPDSFVRRYGAEKIKTILAAALPFHRYFVQSLAAKHDPFSMIGQEAILAEAQELHHTIVSPTLRVELEMELQDVLGVSVADIRNQLLRSRRRPRIVYEDTPSDQRISSEDVLLMLVLRGHAEWSSVRDQIDISVFTPENQRLAEALDATESSLPDIVSGLDEEGTRRASFYALAPIRFKDPDKALRDVMARLVERPALERRLDELKNLMKESLEAGDTNRWRVLAAEREQLKRERLGRKGIHDNQKEASEEEGS